MMNTTDINPKDLNPKDFNLDAWMPAEGASAPAAPDAPCAAPSRSDGQCDSRLQVEALVQALQEGHVSLADDYDDWLHVAFALGHEFGEAGRSYFHQISALSAKYDAAEADKKYTDCLRSQKAGVTLGTLFHLAKQKSVKWNNSARKASSEKVPKSQKSQSYIKREKRGNSLIINDSVNESHPLGLWDFGTFEEKTPSGTSSAAFSQTFTNRLNPTKVPILIRDIMATMSDPASRDKMVLGALAVISGIMPNIYGLYGGHTVYPPLYFIFYGPAASRKGDIRACLHLLKPLADEMRTAQDREREQWRQQHDEREKQGAKAEGRAQRGPEPEEPVTHSPRIPGNSSASAAYMALKANGGWGVIFETEADVISQALLSDYGDYSTGLRQAFHHEAITMNRVKDRLHIEIPNPRLAVAITCTPGQLPKLFPSFENGLGSRFLFYGLPQEMRWISPFDRVERPLEEVYEEFGQRMLQLCHLLQQMGKRRIQFVLTDSQQQRFNEAFSQLLQEQFAMLGDGIASFVFRMGLSTFRMAMVLSLLRRFDGWVSPLLLFDPEEQTLVCNDDDFNTALTIMDTLVSHTAAIYSELAQDALKAGADSGSCKLKPAEAALLDALPEEFTTAEVVALANARRMGRSTAYRSLSLFLNRAHLVVRISQGRYRKVAAGNTENNGCETCADEK